MHTTARRGMRWWGVGSTEVRMLWWRLCTDDQYKHVYVNQWE